MGLSLSGSYARKFRTVRGFPSASKVVTRRSRDRELTDRELAAIWHELPGSDYGAIVRLLILTGQRREEIGALRWTEVDPHERKIALPPSAPRTIAPMMFRYLLLRWPS